MKNAAIVILAACAAFGASAQDTFSILAYDSLTREVGAAGASCVDLTGSGFSNHFIVEIFPDTGAIATQAAYWAVNQTRARQRMRAGDGPDSILAYMMTHDFQSNPSLRQYGVIRFGYPSAAFTGTNCTDHKSHRVGKNYTIHGNILLGPEVLDSMEARFLRAKGDLACKLMFALQGANEPGADSRCLGNNSSALFAFLKVSSPTNTFGNHAILVGLRTAMGDSIEPIDSLQKLFEHEHLCPVDDTGLRDGLGGTLLSVHPNPANAEVTVEALAGRDWVLRVYDHTGRLLRVKSQEGSLKIDVSGWSRGLYFFELRSGRERAVKKLLLE